MSFVTCDLVDANADTVSVATEVQWHDFGKRQAFSGPIVTIKCFEDNSRLKEQVAEPGEGRVLVVDGGASLRHALIGGDLAAKAMNNGWNGILIYGACRDVGELAELDIGVKALGCVPIKSVRRGEGLLDLPVSFGGIVFTPGQHLYADANGVIVAPNALD